MTIKNPFPKGSEIMLDGSDCTACNHPMDDHMVDSYCLDCHPVNVGDVCFPDEASESPGLEAAKAAVRGTVALSIAMILGYAFGDAKTRRLIRKMYK